MPNCQLFPIVLPLPLPGLQKLFQFSLKISRIACLTALIAPVKKTLKF